MPGMPPFVIGESILKATRRIPDDRAKLNPDGRLMRRMEKQGTERLTTALNKLRLDLFRGINAENVHLLTMRLNDKEVTQPFQDAVTALVQEWALAGADFGHDQIERTIYGTQ